MFSQKFILVSIIIIGILTSYQDIVYRKIRNWTIVTGLLFSIGTHFRTFTALYLLHILSAFIIGFFLYKYGLWSAADGKLFGTFIALLPPKTYLLFSLQYLINSFLLIAIYLIVKAVVNADYREVYSLLRKELQKSSVLSQCVRIFTVVLLLGIISQWVSLSSGLSILVSIIAIGVLEGYLQNPWILFILSLGLTWYYYLPVNITTLITILILYIFVRYILFAITLAEFSTKIPIDSFRSTMTLADNLIPSSNVATISQLKKEGVTHVHVYQMMPFAPFLFLGAIITFWIGIDVISYVL